MESKNFEVYTAPEVVDVEFEINGVILQPSPSGDVLPGGSEGGEIGDDL